MKMHSGAGLSASLLLSLVILGLAPAGRMRWVSAAACITNPVVTSTADSGAGSLRQAILDACPGSTITFAVTGTITLTTGELDVDQNLTIQGPGANLLTVSGNNAVRVFNLGSNSPAINVTLSGLTIANGKPPFDPKTLIANGGGILINSTGTVTVTNCAISGNTAGGAASANGGFGGGINNNSTGTLTVTGSTISGNLASSGVVGVGEGGGIFNNSTAAGSGTVNLANSTISGNFASGFDLGLGGGIYNAFTNTDSGTINVTNCTISGNTVGSGSSDVGGGIHSGSTLARVTVKNSIIALNVIQQSGASFSAPDFFGSATSQGNNLIGTGDGSTGFSNGVNGDQVGVMGSPLDPKLGSLANNGGPTFTMALLGGSPAIDAGSDSVLGAPLFLTTDQRGAGFPRKAGLHVDIGAFELQFDTCLKDNSSGNLLRWNSTTGQYQFTRCSDGFTLNGTGLVGHANGLLTLTDSKADRKISAGFNPGSQTGSATINLMVAPGLQQTLRINDTNPHAVCSCS